MGQRQAASSLFTKSVDAGNLVVYYSTTVFTSFSGAIASTKWRKLGLLTGCQLEISTEKLQFQSGTPRTLVEQIQTALGLRITGGAFEFRPIILALALGLLGSDITYALKTGSPTPTTTVTGATKTSVIVSDATGFEADRLIKVGSGYGIIKTISGNTLTLYEGLDTDTDPTVGDAVSEVDTSTMDVGGLGSANHIALKLTKTIVSSSVDAYSIYVPKAQADPNISMNFADGDSTEKVSIPFAFDALSDPDVESGKLARCVFTQS
jgi:hypothetical protein